MSYNNFYILVDSPDIANPLKPTASTRNEMAMPLLWEYPTISSKVASMPKPRNKRKSLVGSFKPLSIILTMKCYTSYNISVILSYRFLWFCQAKINSCTISNVEILLKVSRSTHGGMFLFADNDHAHKVLENKWLSLHSLSLLNFLEKHPTFFAFWLIYAF